MAEAHATFLPVIDKSTNVRVSSFRFRLLRTVFGVLGYLAPGLVARWAARLFLTTRRHRPSQSERRVLGTSEAFSVWSGGYRLAVWSWGVGPTVLLVHGWNGRGTQLGALVAPLVQRGYRVVTFDTVGHGDSDGKRATLVDMADAVGAVAEAVGPVMALIAHSMGGAVTTIAMADGLAVQRAVYIAPPADPARWIEIFAEFLGFSEDLTDRMTAYIERLAGRKVRDLRGPVLARSMTTPLLVIHDRDDLEVPWRESSAVATAWPGASTWRTAGLGHRRVLRDPGVVEKIVRFISKEVEDDQHSQEIMAANLGLGEPVDPQ